MTSNESKTTHFNMLSLVFFSFSLFDPFFLYSCSVNLLELITFDCSFWYLREKNQHLCWWIIQLTQNGNSLELSNRFDVRWCKWIYNCVINVWNEVLKWSAIQMSQCLVRLKHTLWPPKIWLNQIGHDSMIIMICYFEGNIKLKFPLILS